MHYLKVCFSSQLKSNFFDQYSKSNTIGACSNTCYKGINFSHECTSLIPSRYQSQSQFNISRKPQVGFSKS